jgi:hypothetical protein
MLAHRLVSYQGAVFASSIPGDMEAAEIETQARVPSEAPAPNVPALTQAQLAAVSSAQPAIGQEVGLFEIAEMT